MLAGERGRKEAAASVASWFDDPRGEILRAEPDDRVSGGRAPERRRATAAGNRGLDDRDDHRKWTRGQQFGAGQTNRQDDKGPSAQEASAFGPVVGGPSTGPGCLASGRQSVSLRFCLSPAAAAADRPTGDPGKRPPNIAILAGDGEVLANRGDTGGPAIRLGELPPCLPKAFIAIEDRRFFALGIDPVGIGCARFSPTPRIAAACRAARRHPAARQNLFLTQERTMSRKIQEAIRPCGSSTNIRRTRSSSSPEPRLFRFGRLWRRSRRAEIFRAWRETTLTKRLALAGFR